MTKTNSDEEFNKNNLRFGKYTFISSIFSSVVVLTIIISGIIILSDENKKNLDIYKLLVCQLITYSICLISLLLNIGIYILYIYKKLFDNYIFSPPGIFIYPIYLILMIVLIIWGSIIYFNKTEDEVDFYKKEHEHIWKYFVYTFWYNLIITTIIMPIVCVFGCVFGCCM